MTELLKYALHELLIDEVHVILTVYSDEMCRVLAARVDCLVVCPPEVQAVTCVVKSRSIHQGTQ